MMTPWMSAVNFFFLALSQYLLTYLLETLLVPRFSIRSRRLLSSLFVATFVLINQRFSPPDVKMTLGMALYIANIFIFYRGKFPVKLLCFTLWMGLYVSAEALYIVLAPGLGWNLMDMNALEQLRTDITCSLIAGLLALLLNSVMRLISDHLNRKLWGMLTLTAFSIFSVIIIILCNLYTHINTSPDFLPAQFLPQLNALSILLLFVVLIGIFSLVYHLNNSMHALEESHLAETHAREELYRSELRIQKDEQQRHLMHDMKNHFLTVDLLAQQGQYERMHEYLAGLSAAFEASAVHSYCGHPLIDSILDSKLARMQKAGITAHFAQQKLSDPTALRIRDLDLCAVVGNLLDNAIEACEQLPRDAERCVKVNISATDSALVVQTLNPCKDAKTEAQRALHGRSVRGRYRGTGLKSVRRIVDAYGGELLIQPTDDGAQLSVSAYLPNPCA